MGEAVNIWYDKEGDYLEVLFDRKAGHFRETDNDAVMEKIDSQGNILGSVLKVSALSDRLLSPSASRNEPPNQSAAPGLFVASVFW